MGLQVELIRQMRGQQENKWQTMHNIWQVEDLKILHMEKKLVDDLIGHMSIKFGKEETLPSTSKKYSNTLE